ncbi:hypothetical protein QPX36_09635 [Corynebacterium accolens]|uniref:hypothetical protein n=1 Tax=Corynebacterium accolens TaxID=38284 RepID=UPI0001E17025|nr:hypothetical protein [Corynebacterium accolens]EFM42867.1 hypothetical protein HMPREF0277_2066 [Corynebacterium accolens ATCC 49726]MDK4233467.1 hypothetical protein [Corynebacterium accolens]
MPTAGHMVLNALADAAGLGLDLDLSAVHEGALTAAFSELGIPATSVGETTNRFAQPIGSRSPSSKREA